MTDLAILCVSNGEPYSVPFRAELERLAFLLAAEYVEFDGSGAAYVEQVLDEAVASCPDGYILRIDDDERVSKPMQEWLLLRTYREADHWAFPRMNLWPDSEHHVVSHSLYPDLQTRLSVKAKSGGRACVHEGSPFGTGEIAQVALEHHKFLVRGEAERRSLLAGYESLGAGRGFEQFSIPEDLTNIEIRCRAAVAA